MVKKLLHCEANFGIKNILMETALTNISPSVLEEFLDECIDDHCQATHVGYQINFRYPFLGPPLIRHRSKKLESAGNIDLDEDDIITDNLPEAEPLWYMSQSTAHAKLLAHPVITSFLCLKWQHTWLFLFFNLLLYSMFVGVLTFYLRHDVLHNQHDHELNIYCNCINITPIVVTFLDFK